MGLRGTLAELSLVDLIEMTSLGGKTGRVVLFDQSGAVAGELAFREGRLVAARHGELTAQRAFYALLGMTTGSFDFDLEAGIDDEDGLDLETQPFLVEGVRRLDELDHLRLRWPAAAAIGRLGGESHDVMEARALEGLRPGSRVRDVVAAVVAGGEADEYDALLALDRLAGRGVVRVETSVGGGAPTDGPPQP